MSDIFLSYASEDQERVMGLVHALKKAGWSVFWDRTIPPGKTWREVIGTEVAKCRSMIVCWSSESVQSSWVVEEAGAAKRRGILIPVLLDPVEPPFGFAEIEAADLVNWKGEAASPGFQGLIAALQALLGEPTQTKVVPATREPTVEAAEPTRPDETPKPKPGPWKKVAWVAGIGVALVLLILALPGPQPGTGPQPRPVTDDTILAVPAPQPGTVRVELSPPSGRVIRTESVEVVGEASVAPATVRFGDHPAVVSGRRFRVRLPLEKGLNRFPVVLTEPSGRRTELGYSVERIETPDPEIRQPGVYLTRNVRRGAPLTRDAMVEIPGRIRDSSIVRPQNFDAHLRGARFIRDLPEGHRLEWSDLTVGR